MYNPNMDEKVKQENIQVIKKEIQIVEIIVNQGRFNKKNQIPDLHDGKYYAKMCLYHMSLKTVLKCIEENKKINYH